MKHQGRPVDGLLYSGCMVLLAIGIVMVFSASSIRAMKSYNDPYYFLKRQLIWAGLGLIIMTVLANIHYVRLRKIATTVMAISLLFLVLVLVPGIGKVINGSRRWIGIGQIGFQPSELCKGVFVLFMAASLSERGKELNNPVKGLLPYVLLIGVIFGLVLKEPDLGTGIAIAGTGFMLLFAGGIAVWQLTAIGVVALPVLWHAINSATYRRNRFLAFLNPWADPTGTGYHIIQGLYALGSGGPFGLGFMRSRQKWLYLPEPHTDFIFAVIGEELGFIGCLAVISLFMLIAWRGYRISMTAPDRFGSLLAAGMTTMIILQAIVNIGVVTASLPVTGIPLPFISSGGSSLMTNLAAVGVLLNISRYTVE
ncbi:MAG TPA: putative lipid II flippase FtsW [Firmicutes bacterium]|nr:putative lipid II flippase FtsW [Bacillota bacterium]